VAQGPRKGHASVEWKKCLCLQQKAEKGRGGGAQGAPRIAVIAEYRATSHPRKPKPSFPGTPVIAVIGRTNLPLICADDR
jgi:hypothetical protein